jgi:competence protein ComGC
MEHARVLLTMKTKCRAEFNGPALNPNLKQAGFTRADLVAVLATLSVLAALTATAISATKTASNSAGCIDNLRALTRAWLQFEFDHNSFAPNPDDGNSNPGFNWVPGAAGHRQHNEFNPDILTYSVLYPYLLGTGVGVFRCPDDLRQGAYQGTDPQRSGTIVPAARSYAMNGAVGADPYAKLPGTPTHGPWLDNYHAHTRSGEWRTYGKLDHVIDPAPSKLAVLLDEDAYSLNDGHFAFGMNREEWIDWPGTRHQMGGVIAFADGRAELRRWVDERTVVQNERVSRLNVPGSEDYNWLRQHISAPKSLTRSIILVRSFGPRAADVKLAWPAKAGATHEVEYSDNLTDWKPLNAALQSSATDVSIVDPEPPTHGRRFYRLVTN